MRDPAQVLPLLLTTARNALLDPAPDRVMTVFGPPVWDDEQLTAHLSTAGLGLPNQPVIAPVNGCDLITSNTYVITLLRAYPAWDAETGYVPAADELDEVSLRFYSEAVSVWNALAALVSGALSGDPAAALGVIGAAILPLVPQVPSGGIAGVEITVIGT